MGFKLLWGVWLSGLGCIKVEISSLRGKRLAREGSNLFSTLYIGRGGCRYILHSFCGGLIILELDGGMVPCSHRQNALLQFLTSEVHCKSRGVESEVFLSL